MKATSLPTFLAAVVLGIAAALGDSSLFAQVEKPEQEDSGSSARTPATQQPSAEQNKGPCDLGLDDLAAVQECVDQLVAQLVFYNSETSGAIVAVVRNGKAILTRGYGCANSKHRSLIDIKGEETLFRVGSVSKLFTATAVMQLAEQGKLGRGKSGSGRLEDILETDVNFYLSEKLKIPATFLEPVTLKNLLTHTAGFADDQIDIIKRHPRDVQSLETYLSEHIPARVRPPTTNYHSGVSASYSNWGFSLLGYIVARKSDEKDFDAYVKKHIFDPLDMGSSTFSEPGEIGTSAQWSMRWEKNMAKGHDYKGKPLSETPEWPITCPPHNEKIFEPQEDFEYLHAAGPAMGLTTTAADMAKFMIAHLPEVDPDSPRLLQDLTVNLMHSRMLIPDEHEEFNAGGLGFYELHRRGLRLLTHSGKTIWFASKLALLPSENLGIFIAVNSPIGDMPLDNFVKGFINTHFLKPEFPPPPPLGSLQAYVGTYWFNFASRTSEKFFLMAGPGLTTVVSLDEKRPCDTGTTEQAINEKSWGSGPTLKITNLFADTSFWMQIEPSLFRNVVWSQPDCEWQPSQDLIAFKRNAAGDVDHIVGPMPFAPAYKLAWHEMPAFHQLLKNIASAAFIITIIWHALAGFRPMPTVPRLALWLATALGIVDLLATELLIAAFSSPDKLIYGHTPSVKIGLGLLLLALPLTFCALGFLILAWLRHYWSLPGRIQYSFFVIMAFSFLWSMRFWNLIG